MVASILFELRETLIDDFAEKESNVERRGSFWVALAATAVPLVTVAIGSAIWLLEGQWEIYEMGVVLLFLSFFAALWVIGVVIAIGFGLSGKKQIACGMAAGLLIGLVSFVGSYYWISSA